MESYADRLARLRQKYLNAGGGYAARPEFAKVSAHYFREDERRKWPFSDPPTFLEAPLCRDFEGLNIALVGVPMDLGVTNRNGARFGPQAVRAIEHVGPFEHVFGIDPLLEGLRVADIGDVPFRSRFSLETCHEDIFLFYKNLKEKNIIPVSVGGDHSITYSILRALGAEEPVGMVHIDAHCDTGGVYEGTKFHHGGPFRQAVLDGVLNPQRVIQIGIRGGSEYLWEFSYESGMHVIHAEDVPHMGMPAIIQKARDIVGAGPVYVSFDIDSLDPGFAPGTGTPEVGGLMPREVLELLRGLRGLDVIGGDVVEVAPQYDSTSNTAHCGAQMLFQILCLVVESKKQRAQ